MASIEAVQAALELFDKVPQWFRELSLQARKDRAKVYELGLRDLEDKELLAAAELAVGACKWFPVPAELRELVRPKVVVQAQLRDAAEDAYRAIVDQYERGLWCSYDMIVTSPISHPRATAAAFLAAGGHEVFSWCEPGPDQAFRQKRFIESYLLHAEAEQAQGALAAGSSGSIGRGEAVEILKQLGEKK